MILIASTEVMGQECTDNLPVSCTTPGGWSFFAGEEIDGVTYGQCPGEAMDFDHDGSQETPDITVYPCEYKVCMPGTGPGSEPFKPCDDGTLNHVLIAVKKCCPEDIEFYPLPGATHPEPYAFGAGDPVFGWLKDYFQARVLRTPPQSDDETYGFRSTAGTADETTMCVKSKKSLECCQIRGLDCPDPAPELAQAAVTTMSFVTTNDGRDFMIDEDPYTQCINWVYEKVPCEDGKACRLSQGSEEKCKYDVPEEDCADGWYWYPLDKAASSEVLTATPAGGGEPVTDVATQSPCGRAVIKAGDNTLWFFLMFGWAFF